MSRSTAITNKGVLIGTPQAPWRLLRAAAPEDTETGVTLDSSFELSQILGHPNLVDLQALFGNTYQRLALCFFSSRYGGHNPEYLDYAGLELYGYGENDSSGFNMPTLIAAHGLSVTNLIIGNVTVPKSLATNGLWFGLVGAVTSGLFDSEWQSYVTNRISMVVYRMAGIRYLYHSAFTTLGASTAGEAPSIGIIGRVF